MPELLDSSVLDALAPALTPRIIGPAGGGLIVDSGTFTPVLATTTGDVPGVVYGFRAGRWVRIGNMVFLAVSMQITSISSPPADQAQIRGLPFTRGAAALNTPFQLYLANVSIGGLGVPAADWAGANKIRLLHLNNNAGPSSILVSALGANCVINIGGVYETD